MVMKTSLVCLLLVFCMGLFYFSNRHLPLKSTKLFSYFYCSTFMVMVLKVITFYTVNHMNQIPDGLNLAVHLVYLLSISVMVFLFFLYIRSLMKSRDKCTVILVSFPLLIVVSVMDILMPEFLGMIVYVTLMLVGFMMSKENTEKYLDKQTGMFNQYALETVCGEYCASGKNTDFLVTALCEAEDALDRMSWKQYTAAMKQVECFCKKNLQQQPYRACGNGFVFPVPSYQTAMGLTGLLEEYSGKQFGGEVSFSYKIMELDNRSDVKEFLSEMVEFCTDAMNRMASHDYLTKVRNRNSYEKELTRIIQEGVDAFYFLADLNNLKDTNDRLGHSMGDELLQTFARVLKTAAGKEGMVFRYGGDEFVVLWNGEDAKQYLAALEECCRLVNQERAVPLEFAIGYGRVLEEDGLKKADRMMYENKIRMKAKHGY